MAFFAVDFGGSHVSCGLVEDGKLLAVEEIRVADASLLAPVLPGITACLKKLDGKTTQPPEGVGVGFCALVDEKANRVASTNAKYEDAPDIDLPAWSLESLGLPLLVANDARLALRGEMLAGAARNADNVVMFTLGTGIGGVAAIDGRLPDGAHGFAANLGGHVPVTLNGRRCTCGGIGCAESEASGWSLPIVCREQPDFSASGLARTEINFRNLFELASSGDAVALRVREHCLHVWALTTVSAVLSFDPSVVVFGGGVMRAKALILPYIQRYVEENAWTPKGAPRIVAAELGNRAALFGVERLFGERR